MLYNDLIKIKNAYLAKHREVVLPYTEFTYKVVKILSKKGYVGNAEIAKFLPNSAPEASKGKRKNFSTVRSGRKVINIELLYTEGAPHLNDLRFISKPGQRIYKGFARLHPVRHGFGDIIISTSKGVMTASQAKKAGVGGEVICEVY